MIGLLINIVLGHDGHFGKPTEVGLFPHTPKFRMDIFVIIPILLISEYLDYNYNIQDTRITINLLEALLLHFDKHIT